MYLKSTHGGFHQPIGSVGVFSEHKEGLGSFALFGLTIFKIYSPTAAAQEKILIEAFVTDIIYQLGLKKHTTSNKTFSNNNTSNNPD